MFVLSLGI